MSGSTTISYDERFDKIDSQFQETREQFNANDKKFNSIYGQLDKLITLLVKGFGRFDKELEKSRQRRY